MDNTGLLRCAAEMTLLQPHLGDSRRHELRNSPFWPTPTRFPQVEGNRTTEASEVIFDPIQGDEGLNPPPPPPMTP